MLDDLPRGYWGEAHPNILPSGVAVQRTRERLRELCDGTSARRLNALDDLSSELITALHLLTEDMPPDRLLNRVDYARRLLGIADVLREEVSRTLQAIGGQRTPSS